MGKDLSYSFVSINTPNYDANSAHENPYNTLRIGLHDKVIYPNPLFTPTWFSDAFIALFGYPCYILTQCGIYFSTYRFVQATLTLIIKLYKRISIKYNHNQNITLFSSIAHGFFNFLTDEMVDDQNHTHRKNLKLALPTSKSHDNFSDILYPFSDNQTLSINNTNGITSPPLFYTKYPNKFRFTRLALFPERLPLSQPIINYRTFIVPSSQQENPTQPNYSNSNAIQHDNYPNQQNNLTTRHDNLANNTSVKSGTDTPIKVYSKTNYPVPHHLSKTDIILLSKLI